MARWVACFETYREESSVNQWILSSWRPRFILIGVGIPIIIGQSFATAVHLVDVESLKLDQLELSFLITHWRRRLLGQTCSYETEEEKSIVGRTIDVCCVELLVPEKTRDR